MKNDSPTKQERQAKRHAEMIQLVGSISVSFARVEAKLNNVIRQLLRAPDPILADVVTDNLSFSQTVDLFRRLCAHVLQGNALQDRVKPLVKDLEDSSRERNNIIHSCPYTDPRRPDSTEFEKVRKRQLKMNTAVSEMYTKKRLNEILKHIFWTDSEVQDFGWKLMRALQTVDQPPERDK